MIYTAKKNGHTRTFSDADGKLLYYRRNHWHITAELGTLDSALKPHPVSQINREKPVKRRERRFTMVMGHRVFVE